MSVNLKVIIYDWAFIGTELNKHGFFHGIVVDVKHLNWDIKKIFFTFLIWRHCSVIYLILDIV